MIDGEKLEELEKVLAERLKNNLNKFKMRAKEKFGLCEVPLIFHFDPKIGPVYFCSNEQSRPSYISEQNLSKFGGLTDILDLEDCSNSDGDVISLRHWDGKKYVWEVFFDCFDVVHNKGPNMARGGKEMFSIGVVGRATGGMGLDVVKAVGSYLQRELQRYFLH